MEPQQAAAKLPGTLRAWDGWYTSEKHHASGCPQAGRGVGNLNMIPIEIWEFGPAFPSAFANSWGSRLGLVPCAVSLGNSKMPERVAGIHFSHGFLPWLYTALATESMK